MKFKATRRNMQNNYHYIISASYCSLQFLLKYRDPIAHSAGNTGWTCDYYDVNGVLISTGYAPINAKNTNCNYDLKREYDNKAREIICSNLDWQEKENQVNSLLEEFVKMCKGE